MNCENEVRVDLFIFVEGCVVNKFSFLFNYNIDTTILLSGVRYSKNIIR